VSYLHADGGLIMDNEPREDADKVLYCPPWCDGMVLDYGLADAVPLWVVGVLLVLIVLGVGWLALAG
jgi:hypothetical protein